eukprot:CAMPEP_0114595344 /NCGR_PEP_ID=MMETSP0125-20121206/17120_1 /TAXON_ID=485358 ORGANISM="Aristerostoma sp., Strain ATCC 50986" /NCGR_SAMPLE_ID=MMETSP0125 /ASSEMBLY_ACC=CAM_ASM_000245 /LENGTH=58 /DNA_ID=CAMNT_0001796793 /DNA_START=1157 /DNA_END=1333 /DNA_ORIENTATION=+
MIKSNPDSMRRSDQKSGITSQNDRGPSNYIPPHTELGGTKSDVNDRIGGTKAGSSQLS